MNKNILKSLNEEKEKERAVYLLSFLLPLILIVAILISKRVFPFGDKCILKMDFYHQYLPFHTLFANKLKNFSSLFYTHNIGLGTNFLTIIAYYLASPFNLLLFIIPTSAVLEYLTIMVVLKLSLSSLFMSIYLVSRYKTNSFFVIFISMFYGMSGFMGAYYWDVMWLDNVMIFPLLMLGYENLLNGKKPFLYIIMLFLSIFCNYYIGAITCIFIFFYFIFYNIYRDHNLKQIGKNLIKVSAYSLISILMSGILLIPVFFAFKTTASSEFEFPEVARNYFSLVEVIARHLPFVGVENGVDAWPNIYCGTICFVLIIMYIMSKKFKLKEKMCYLVLILFFLASFSVNYLNFFWHILKYPNSLPARQSFIYIFIILTICMKPLLKLNSYKVSDVAKAFGISILFLIIIEKMATTSKWIGFYSVYIGIILLFIYLCLFIAYKNKSTNKNVLLYVVVIVISLETFFNLYQTSFHTIKRDDYMKNTESIRNLKSGIKNITDEFYRVSREEMLTKNDGAYLGFPSASIFSSSAYASGTEFYKTFGMEASTNAYSVTGSTPFTDSILDIKYTISENKKDEPLSVDMREIANENGVYLYQNIDSLPFSYVLKDSFLADYDMSSGNPATVHNNFSRTLKEGVLLDKKKVEIQGKIAKYRTDEKGLYYVFVRDKGIKQVTIVYETTTKTFKNLNRGYFINLGYLGADVDLEFRNDTNDSDLLIELFKFNFNTLKKVSSNINSNSSMKMIAYDDSHISYSIKANVDGTCLITLPYDKGFTLYVDDKIVDKKEVLNFFLGFDIKKGDHIIKLVYKPLGFNLGEVSSILGIILFGLLIMADKMKKKKEIKIDSKNTVKCN